MYEKSQQFGQPPAHEDLSWLILILGITPIR
jgi:hypothetical protein